MRIFSQPGYALVGVWPIAHHIPQAPNHVELACVEEHSFQRGQVAMNIGNHQTAHAHLTLYKLCQVYHGLRKLTTSNCRFTLSLTSWAACLLTSHTIQR